MAARARKRVHAFYPPLRAPDGSAFIHCELCGASVPIALADMHDCEEVDAKKRRKNQNNSSDVQKMNKTELLRIRKNSDEELSIDIHDQPRSPFCFFMEEFSKNFEGDVLIEVSERGFQIWKNMSIEERNLYVLQAEDLDADHQDQIFEEIGDIPKVAHEAISQRIDLRQCRDDSSGFDVYSDYESES